MRATFWVISFVVAVATQAVAGSTFPRPASLEPAVRFWTSIFTEYSLDQVLVHDEVDLDKIYRVLDFRPDRARGLDDDAIASIRKHEIDRVVSGLQAALVRLDRHGDRGRPLTKTEARIVAMFRSDRSPAKYRLAADRIRTQRGIRERFEQGVRRSRRYLPTMERVFRREGLPVELTRLPLIESSFDVMAYSKVGAAGIWQFMPATGRRFLTVGSLVDERMDPVTATVAAARFLKENYEQLGSWPLAITAYNHGPAGMMRAVSEVGTSDIGEIVRRYDGPSFGFASRNFYAEFLAALDVDEHADRHFGPIVASRDQPTTRIRVEPSVPLAAAARLAETTPTVLADLNPALLPPVIGGRYDIPSGYRLRVPRRSADGFDHRLASYAAERQATRVASASSTEATAGTFTYRVRRGDTLSTIAERFGVSVAALRRSNDMRGSTIRAGASLRVPGMRSYRVRPGDNLSALAKRFGVSVPVLKATNGRKSSTIRVGEVLRIPGSS
jgi:membrane-bound lytic murein transglycosylase D